MNTANSAASTHEVTDFGPGPQDNTQGCPFEGTEAACRAWIDAHQETHNGRERYALGLKVAWEPVGGDTEGEGSC